MGCELDIWMIILKNDSDQRSRDESYNVSDGINRRLDISEESISKLEDLALETIQNETQSRRKLKINSINRLWSNLKHSNIYVIGILKEEEKRGQKNVCKEIMAFDE